MRSAEFAARLAKAGIPPDKPLHAVLLAAFEAAEAAREVALREELYARVRAAVPDAVRHGAAADDDPAGGLPGVLSVGLPGAPGDAVVMLLDAAGVDASTGSACSAGVTAASHVLTALGVADVEARSVVRFSIGHTTSRADLERVSAVLGDVVARTGCEGVREAGDVAPVLVDEVLEGGQAHGRPTVGRRRV